MASLKHDGRNRLSPPSWWTGLIADPDTSARQQLTERWADAGGAVTACLDGASALFHAGRRSPDIVLLSAVLPEVSVEVAVRVMREFVVAPILLALGPGDAELLGDRLGQALLAGASRLIVRPYTEGDGLAELDVHVDRLRQRRESTSGLSIGSLHMDAARFEARIEQHSLELAVREFRILYYLMDNYHRVVTAEEIQDAVWGSAGGKVTTNTLAVHMGRLRKSLGEAAQITHIRRVGYRLSVADAP